MNQFDTQNRNLWLLPDPHFHHKKLVRDGYRPANYAEQVKTNWLQKVQSNDVVFCLGDVTMGRHSGVHQEYVVPMPGYKVLVRGNHDNNTNKWYLEHGWNEVHNTFQLTVDDLRVLLSHVPQVDDGTYDVNVHGHFHNDLHRAMEPAMVALRSPKQQLLALECLNYDLVTLQDLLAGKVVQEGLPVY